MAQYQKNFYASSLYGHIKAFYGEYLSEIFDAQELFSSSINTKIEARLRSSFYEATQPEFTIANPSDWSIQGTSLTTNVPNSSIEMFATGEDVEVHIKRQDSGQQTIQADLLKEEKQEDGSYQYVLKQTKTIDTFSLTTPNTTDQLYFDSFGFGNYKVQIKALANTAPAILEGVQLRTTDYAIQIRTSADKLSWSEWEPIPQTLQFIQADQFSNTGQSKNYTNVQFAQAKIILMSSDNQSSPIIDRIELRSDDSGLYEADGDYTAKIDMNQVATSIGKTFSHANKIRWVQRLPEGTSLDIRSASSLDNVFWGPITAPYRQNTNRLRLKRGITNHSILLGPFDEGTKFDFSKTANFLNWDTQAYLPKDSSNTKVTYVFSKTKNNQKDPLNLLQSIDNPMNEQNQTIQFKPQPYFLTVEMTRSALRGTPVVDFIDIYQNLRYEEAVNVTNRDVSLADNEGTGIKTLQKVDDYSFTYPNSSGEIAFNAQQIAAAPQKYSLVDNTGRPNEVILYFKSEEEKGTKSNVSTLATDEIIAKAIQQRLEYGDTTGVLMHYQYGAGKVQYLLPYQRDLDSTFTPSLLDDKKYRYFIGNGWPNEVHTVVAGQTLADVADMYSATSEEIEAINHDLLFNEDQTLVQHQQITIPNHYINDKVLLQFSNGTAYTEKSSHNALYEQSIGETVTDFSSEAIDISVPVEPEKGYVDWTSEEKIYKGVINANDIRGEFVRTQYNNSTHTDLNRSYVVEDGDTWDSISTKFDVHIQDLQLANSESDSLEVGQTLVVPPNIILPEIAPEVEFETESLYEISIIPDSVHKKNGQRLDESFIPIDWNAKHLPMTVTYRDSEILTAEMVRGTDLNGMDPLPLSHVKEIVSIKGKDNGVTYHAWDEDLRAGDYKLKSNYVDWSPTQQGVLEPEPGEEYIVTYIREEIDTVEIHLDTTYFEKTGTDIVWRSPEVKVFDGICTPSEDFQMELPSPDSFEGFEPSYKNVNYLIEDNDLWVDTSIKEIDGKTYLIGTLNRKDPSKNWYPTINTGYYYLKEKEFYLYSEPMKTVLTEKDLPTATDIQYVNGQNGIGALLLPNSENILKDSTFTSTDWKPSKIFSIASL